MSKNVKPARTVLDAYKFLRREVTLLGSVLLAEAGLGAKQATALICLQRSGAVTMGELAEYIQSDNAAATRIATSLEAMGLITRSASTTDRRQMVMRLTAKGVRKAPTAVGVQDELNRRIAAVLSKDDQRSLSALMDRLSDALRADRERGVAVVPVKKTAPARRGPSARPPRRRAR